MTAHDDMALEALKRATGPDAQVHVRTLPGPVTDAMQELVNAVQFRCVHVSAADGLPPAALDKLCIRGVPGIWCSQPVCVADAAQHITVWRLRINDRCVLCDRAQTRYRTAFEDQAAGLTMVAWVCGPCTSKLAAWVGLP